MFGLTSRDEAKPINFGIIFGQGPQALAREVNKSWKEQELDRQIDEAQAHSMIQTFSERYAEIERYFDREYEKLIVGTKLEKVLKNPLTGRVRRFQSRNSAKLKRVMKATLLQQVESHLLKLALINLHSELRGLNIGCRIVMAVHDSIWVEAPKQEAQETSRRMKDTMVKATNYPLVPFDVEFH
jgi:DNA polymerase I